MKSAAVCANIYTVRWKLELLHTQDGERWRTFQCSLQQREKLGEKRNVYLRMKATTTGVYYSLKDCGKKNCEAATTLEMCTKGKGVQNGEQDLMKKIRKGIARWWINTHPLTTD